MSHGPKGDGMTIVRAGAVTERPTVNRGSCACGHSQDAHHRGVTICRKIFCPCNAYDAARS